MPKFSCAVSGFLIAAGLWAHSFCAFAGSDPQEKAIIKLKDGGVIVGRVLGQEDDRYRIMTGTMGIVTVREADIAGIQDDRGLVWEKYQKAVVENPQTVATIQGLGQDEEIIKIVSDPQIRDAVARQDLEYLRTNEKFIKFMNNPTVKEIIRNTQDAVKSK